MDQNIKAMKKLLMLLLAVAVMAACNQNTDQNVEDIQSSPNIIKLNKLTADSTYNLESRFNACSNPSNDTIGELELHVSNDTVYVNSSWYTTDDAPDYETKFFGLSYEAIRGIDDGYALDFGNDPSDKFFWIPFDNPSTDYNIINGGDPTLEVTCSCTGTGDCAAERKGDETTCEPDDTCSGCCDMTITHGSIFVTGDRGSVVVEADYMNLNGDVYQ